MNNLTSRCGYVAILGLPNAGKSTLTNRLVGTKVAIVTPKAQTTRNRILGIYQQEDTQVVLMDTPGIFAPKSRLDKAMVQAAWGSIGDADVTVLLVDASQRKFADSYAIYEKLIQQKVPCILIFNKIDLLSPEILLPLVDEFMSIGKAQEVFMISSLKGDGVNDLKTYFANHMPLGPWLYPDDQLSDMPQRLLAAEITREQVFLQLQQEIPYQIAVVTEDWKTMENGSAHIHQVIYVSRDGHKGIVLGNKGQRIKQIGSLARKQLIHLLGHPVHLFIHVKVHPNWAEDKEYYQEMGLKY